MSNTFTTTLITGASLDARTDRAWSFVQGFLGELNPKFDLITLDCLKIMAEEEKKTVGIDHSRELTKFLKQKPLQHEVKVGLILEAQHLTVEAQNALLKTLEEPPANSFLILTAASKASLLPTVISRCHLVRLDNLKNDHSTQPQTELEALLDDRAKALDWVNTHKEDMDTREKSLELLGNWEQTLRGKLFTDRDPLLIETIYDLWILRNLIENTNVNTRLAIEEWLLKG